MARGPDLSFGSEESGMSKRERSDRFFAVAQNDCEETCAQGGGHTGRRIRVSCADVGGVKPRG